MSGYSGKQVWNYSDWYNYLKKKRNQTKKMANYTYAFIDPIDGNIRIKLHNTIIVSITPDSEYILNTGGHKTKSTKERMNRYVPIVIYQHKFQWYCYNKYGREWKFYDYLIINRNGKEI